MTIQLLSDDFLVNTTPAGNQTSPQITALADGGFVVTWQSSEGGNGAEIRGRIYDAAGTAAGADFPVNTTAGSASPQITALADGGFVVTWEAGNIRGRIYNAAGTAAGADFRVNTSEASPQTDESCIISST